LIQQRLAAVVMAGLLVSEGQGIYTQQQNTCKLVLAMISLLLETNNWSMVMMIPPTFACFSALPTYLLLTK